MPSYKLTYFNAKGRAEVARLMFTAAGKKFEDCRVENEDWPKVKAQMPQGTMPLLEVDKTKICQSMAIVRFLAREFNLYGKGNAEQAIVDMIIDTILDLFAPAIKIFFNKDEEEKATLLKAYTEETVPRILGFIEKMIVETGKKGFAVGSSLTAADVVLHSYIENCNIQECLSGFPRIEENRKTFEALPRIKEYLAKRPKTAF